MTAEQLVLVDLPQPLIGRYLNAEKAHTCADCRKRIPAGTPHAYYGASLFDVRERRCYDCADRRAAA